jgi:hypothetical protein
MLQPQNTTLGWRLYRALPVVGGMIAGGLLSTTFVYSSMVTPRSFYTLYALGGALYGLMAGLAIWYRLPAFGAFRVGQMTILVGLGFGIPTIVGFELNLIIPTMLTAFILPPIAGALCGGVARRWIAKAGGFPMQLGSPGWTGGGGAYVPLLIVFGSIVASMFPYQVSSFWYPLVIIPYTLAGAVGGYISGRYMNNYLNRGIAWRKQRESEHERIAVAPILAGEAQELGALAQQQVAVGGLLEVVDEPFERKAKDKPKGKPLDLPLPQDARQWRMAIFAMAAGVLLSIGLVAAFAEITSRVVIITTPSVLSIDSGVPTTPPLFYVGQPVVVYNLTPDIEGYTDWVVTEQQWLDETQEWIYEVAKPNGITIMRAEWQLAPNLTRPMIAFPTPTPTVAPVPT